jgi:hypothetical protein
VAAPQRLDRGYVEPVNEESRRWVLSRYHFYGQIDLRAPHALLKEQRDAFDQRAVGHVEDADLARRNGYSPGCSGGPRQTRGHD